MSAISPLAVQMGPLLAKYTPEQITALVDAAERMQSLATQQAAAAAAVAAATAAAAAAQRKKRSKKTAASKVAQKGSAALTRTSNNIAPSRPLNSWMAFRSFHAPIFKTYQQKNISGLLTSLWQNDPFKAKWSIIAKAYSMIREHKAKTVAPLDKFLSLTCPHIGIIPKDEYLSVMGWEIVEENGEMRMERRFTPDVASFPEKILTTNLSAEEVVAFCYHVSYVMDNDGDIPRSSPAAATLTMAAQPASSSTQPAPSVPAQLAVAAPVTQSQQDPKTAALFGRIQAALNENNDDTAGASSALRQTVHDLSGQQYPFNDEFDPYAVQPLTYDPFADNHDAAFSTSSLGTYLAPSGVEFPEAFNVDDFLSNDVFDLNK